MSRLDDVAHEHVAVGVRRLEDDRRAVAAGKISAAARAVGIGHDQKLLFRIDRRAVEFEIEDAVQLGMDERAVGVVARGLRDIDGVAHPVDDVEIIGGEGGVEQRLRIARIRVDAQEEADRALQPFPARSRRKFSRRAGRWDRRRDRRRS